ncbi:GNAT family N-acetyltransferase [Vibrio hangzhouensis]|uniref:GNAT family N-acetyltransferase n=1 Tax=Vibrio hangzhouensis TaxID=462991 RepID=UPI001C9834B8|nr:GNAT family N-acetyltransferase [Vibrio hangzhouensis]MBY6196778.1 GNAT family N-acetyltransferase [Vibrio hangzhouensis]
MIEIQPLVTPVTEEVANLSVNSEQVQYVGIITDILSDSLPQQDENQWVIYSNDIAVGFFILDQAYSQTIDSCPKGAVGLRAFFIDKRYQGLGLAKAAITTILTNYENWLNCDGADLYLTVNCRNQTAYNMYQKLGFDDTGELYLGGEAGPQHIMCFKSKKPA